jgi:acylglycerol lipase
MADAAHRDWDIGTGVAGYEWPANNARAVLLLQHGYAEYAERYVHDYSALIPHLQKKRISVFAIDVRGHGQSPGQPGVTDLREAVHDHIAARRVLASFSLPIILLGHSMGGLITAASVLEHPGDIAGVILSSPGFAKSRLATRLLVNFLAKLNPQMGLVKPEPPEGLSRNPDQVRRFASDDRIYRGKVSAILASSGLKVAHRVRKRSKEWAANTLIIHGTADRFCDYALSVEFAQAKRSNDCTLEIVEGGFHELLNDICATDTLRTLTEWIENNVVARVQDQKSSHTEVKGTIQ